MGSVTHEGFTISVGDRITVKAQGLKVTGTVVTVEHNGPDGWYIQMNEANVPGGFSYWKQGIDGGKIVEHNNKEVQ